MLPISPKNVTNLVNRIVDKYRLLLIYTTLGPGALTKSEIKILLRAGLIKPKFFRPTLKDAYFSTFNKLLISTPLKSATNFTLKHIQESAGNLIDAFTDKLSQDVGNIVNQHILNYSKQLRQAVKEELSVGFLKQKTLRQIVSDLHERTQDHYKNFERIVATEIARAQNLGSVDAMISNNKNKSQDDIYVYVNGHPGKRCKKCSELYYLPDGTPRIFRLNDLLSVGSNYGKKQADWVACLPPLHPNCTDTLLELPSGYGFVNGKLTFISKDHDAYLSQKS